LEVEGLPWSVLRQSTLNQFAALPSSVQHALRRQLQFAIQKDSSLSTFPLQAVQPISEVTMHVPVSIGDFTDFSCSHHHVQSAAEAMTGQRSAPPAFFNMPIGYAGRCSSIDVSGTPVQRPLGQYWEASKPGSKVIFGACKKMDYELELGAIVGNPLPRNKRALASDADEHIFGYVLVNDWSARDIQQLEMIPLGPLNGKNAGTTISPWVITKEALFAFQTSSPPRSQTVLPYLADSVKDALNITLRVQVSAPGKPAAEGQVYCKSNTSTMYWTLAQCLAHQVIGGCGLRTGDLLATGTVSGPGAEEHGCLLEHMRVGETPPRGYLEDGETVTLSGYCGDGVGFGECLATLLPAKDLSA
jgi:fumarylacetoacetase